MDQINHTRDLVQSLIREMQQEETALAADREAAARHFNEREAALADMRVAIRVLEQRERKANPKATPQATLELLEREKEEAGRAQEPTQTFTDRVSETVSVLALMGEHINIGNVYEALVQQNAALPNNARIKIGTILRRLEERGRLRKVSDAKGNESTQYELIEEGSAA